jgi:hypothetical protein
MGSIRDGAGARGCSAASGRALGSPGQPIPSPWVPVANQRLAMSGGAGAWRGMPRVPIAFEPGGGEGVIPASCEGGSGAATD